MTVEDAVRGVAAYGLPGAGAEIRGGPLGTEVWDQFLGRVRSQRLTGHLQAAVGGGAFPVTAEQYEEVQEHHLAACATALFLERRLLEVTAHLQADGIGVLVLKGSAVAHLDYPDPAMRSFGDNDVLVRSEQFEEAIASLVKLGYRRQTVEARPGFERRFAKGTTLDGAEGDELDLHRNLVFGTFGFAIELHRLFEAPAAFSVGGRDLSALSHEARLLHACYHAALGDPTPRYSSVRDIAQMVTAERCDPATVIALARRWHSEAVLARAMHLCASHLGIDLVTPLRDAVSGHRSSRRERRAIESYVGANRGMAAKVRASLPFISGFPSKVAFLRAVLAPDPKFAAAYGSQSGLPWVRRGFRSLLQRGPS